MPTSGTTAESMTALDMVSQAMIEIGVGGVPSAKEMTDGIFRLNGLLKSWQARGCNLWREQDTSITVTGGTSSVTLSTSIRNVFSARHIVSATNERPLGFLTRDEYLSLPNKATVGNPSSYHVTGARTGLTLYVWPVPSTNQTLKIDNERIVETVTAGAEEVDVPAIWHETVWMNLAVRLIPMFGDVDPAIAGMVTQRAAALERDLFDDDRPRSIFMASA